jgi:hypothetical protein
MDFPHSVWKIAIQTSFHAGGVDVAVSALNVVVILSPSLCSYKIDGLNKSKEPVRMPALKLVFLL